MPKRFDALYRSQFHMAVGLVSSELSPIVSRVKVATTTVEEALIAKSSPPPVGMVRSFMAIRSVVEEVWLVHWYIARKA